MKRYEGVDVEDYDPPVGNEPAIPSASTNALATWQREATEAWRQQQLDAAAAANHGEVTLDEGDDCPTCGMDALDAQDGTRSSETGTFSLKCSYCKNEFLTIGGQA